jgi:hypothetical protein
MPFFFRFWMNTDVDFRPRKMGKNTSGKKRAYKPVAKEDRKSLKAWAKGVRETILEPHIASYTDALERDWRAERDYLQDVCNEYHTLIPWRLDDYVEPEEPLPVWDKYAPPVLEDLDEEETALKRKRVRELNKASVT